MNRELESTAIYSQPNTRIRIILIWYVLYTQQIKMCIIPSITQTSRSTEDIVYADLGPNSVIRAAHLQTLNLHDDRVQHEEIRHETAIITPGCAQ